jgi:hypothetical protein
MKDNLFDFATSELSHSAFFAWLIQQIDPNAVRYGRNVRDLALELVNRMLIALGNPPIGNLSDVQKCEVMREERHIDITAYIRLRDRGIGLVIENKVGTHESREHQLADYRQVGNELIKEHFEDLPAQSAFKYLKSDYDFEDPLVRCDGSGNRLDTGFRKFNWKNIHWLFSDKTFHDSILDSYSSWISANHDRIERSLDVGILLSSGGEKILATHHSGQVAMIKAIFSRLLSSKRPCSLQNKDGYLWIRYNCELFILMGTDRGNPWTQLWGWRKDGFRIFYRLQIHYEGNAPKPLLHIKTYGDEKSTGVTEKNQIKDLCKQMVDRHKLSGLWHDPSRFRPNAWETDIGSFGLVSTSIETLKRIEDLHEQLCGNEGNQKAGIELCKQDHASDMSGNCDSTVEVKQRD